MVMTGEWEKIVEKVVMTYFNDYSGLQ